MMRAAIGIIGATGIFALAAGVPAAAQGMMQHVDLASPEMTSAEMTRADVEAAIASATSHQPVDFSGAVLTGANLGADMKNQSMGLMRAVLKSSNLERAILRDADLSRVDLEFASLKNTDLTNASLRGAALGGAILAGAIINGADFDGADLASTRLIDPIGFDAAKNFDKAQNIERLLRE
jgi:uncharacterized protein YjbI with pentapeptide repeats